MNPEQKLALLDSLEPSAKARKALLSSLDMLAPCVWLVPTKKKSESIGCVGGGPLLAPGQSWPSHKKLPLSFILRVMLSTLPDWLELPRHGILQAFGGFPEYRLMVTSEDGGPLSEASPPSAYWDDEPPAGELYERVLLKAAPSLCWSGPDSDEQEGRAIQSLIEQLKPTGAYVRIGGPVDSWIDASSQQEHAYLRSHGHEDIWLEAKPKPESLDARIRRAGPSLKKLIARQESLRWWHRNPTAHQEAISRWTPLFTVFSEGQFMWSDCGHLIYWMDPADIDAGRLERAVGLVASS